MLRKVLCVAIVVLLLCPISAAAEDYSTLSTGDLYAIIDQAKAELLKRELIAAEKAVIFDYEGISVILTGNATLKQNFDGTKTLSLDIIVTNTSDEERAVSLDRLYVNGWEGSAIGAYSLGPGKKAKETIDIYHVDTDAELTEMDQLDTIEFHCHAYNPATFLSTSDDVVTTVQF